MIHEVIALTRVTDDKEGSVELHLPHMRSVMLTPTSQH